MNEQTCRLFRSNYIGYSLEFSSLKICSSLFIPPSSSGRGSPLLLSPCLQIKLKARRALSPQFREFPEKASNAWSNVFMKNIDSRYRKKFFYGAARNRCHIPSFLQRVIIFKYVGTIKFIIECAQTQQTKNYKRNVFPLFRTSVQRLKEVNIFRKEYPRRKCSSSLFFFFFKKIQPKSKKINFIGRKRRWNKIK